MPRQLEIHITIQKGAVEAVEDQIACAGQRVPGTSSDRKLLFADERVADVVSQRKTDETERVSLLWAVAARDEKPKVDV